MKRALLHRGASLDESLRTIVRLGGSHRWYRGSGEIRVEHPSSAKPMRVNGRRKDAPMALVAWINRIAGSQSDAKR